MLVMLACIALVLFVDEIYMNARSNPLGCWE